MNMKRLLRIIAVAGLVLATTAPVLGQVDDDELADLAERLQKRLVRLPGYGAFDWLTFGIKPDKTVVLMGYASRPSVAQEAVNAARRTKGAEVVENRIEVLPTSTMDDNIRARAYVTLYTDPMLQRYSPGGGMTRSQLQRGLDDFAQWGLDNVLSIRGPHQIHIIVKGGRITLKGFLPRQAEKDRAGIVMNSLSGVFEVTNEITTPESEG